MRLAQRFGNARIRVIRIEDVMVEISADRYGLHRNVAKIHECFSRESRLSNRVVLEVQVGSDIQQGGPVRAASGTHGRRLAHTRGVHEAMGPPHASTRFQRIAPGRTCGRPVMPELRRMCAKSETRSHDPVAPLPEFTDRPPATASFAHGRARANGAALPDPCRVAHRGPN